MQIDPIFVFANAIEGCLWIALGVFAMVRRASTGLAIALFAFGISDFVEIRTGAWYEPWWLLTWKTVCVLTIAGLGIVVWRRRSQRDG